MAGKKSFTPNLSPPTPAVFGVHDFNGVTTHASLIAYSFVHEFIHPNFRRRPSLGETRPRRKAIFWEWRGGLGKDYTWPSIGIRDGKWKMLVNKEMKKLELYDIESDWAEKKDVSKMNPEIVQKLSRKLDAWKKSLPKKPDPASCSPAKAK